MIRVCCDVPPSANNLFTGSGRRVKSAAYRAWITKAGWQIKASAPPFFGASRVAGPVRIAIEVGVNRTRDIDNCIKPLLDLCVSMNLIDDDRWVDEVVCRRSAEPGARITIEEASDRISVIDGELADRQSRRL